MAEEVARKPFHAESKKIAKVSPALHGHLALEFEDGTKAVIYRGDHEVHMLVVGDYWPPLPGPDESDSNANHVEEVSPAVPGDPTPFESVTDAMKAGGLQTNDAPPSTEGVTNGE